MRSPPKGKGRSRQAAQGIFNRDENFTCRTPFVNAADFWARERAKLFAVIAELHKPDGDSL